MKKLDTEHCGLVWKRDGDALYTYEGNTTPGEGNSEAQYNGGCVASKIRLPKNIVAVCRPQYTEEEMPKDDITGHWAEDAIRRCMNTARQMLEEYEREQREEEQRRQQRQYAQFQSRQNAELVDWIRGMSPSALADDAQQRRLDTAQGIYTTDADTKHQGSGRSFGTQEVSTPKAQKKRAENDTYRKYLAQYDGVSNQTLFKL